MRKIMIVSDLDGTLLNQNHSISEENKKAIKDFVALGGKFTIATGRMEKAVAPFIEELGLKIPMILYNGAKIYDPVTGVALFDQEMVFPKSFWKELLRMAGEDTAVFVYQRGNVYSPHDNEVRGAYEAKENVVCRPFTEELYNRLVTKILIISSSVAKLSQIEDLIVKEDILCETIYSERNYLEILPPGVSKGNALKKLRALTGEEELHVVAVGDNLNDISMFEEADRGIAVKNAHPLLKSLAKTITVHHEEHALQEIIQRLSEEMLEEKIVK